MTRLFVALLVSVPLLVAAALPRQALAQCPCCTSIHDPGVNSSVQSNGAVLQGLVNQNALIMSVLNQILAGQGQIGSPLDFAASIAPKILPDIAGQIAATAGASADDLAKKAADALVSEAKAQGSKLLTQAFGGSSVALSTLPTLFQGLDVVPTADAMATPKDLTRFAREVLGTVGQQATQAVRAKIMQRRRVEVQDAVDVAWAVAAQNLSSSGSAATRISNAARFMDGASDLRAQVTHNTTVLIGITEQLERTNQLLAAMVRMSAAEHMAGENITLQDFKRPSLTTGTQTALPWQAPADEQGTEGTQQ